ncbi:MAG: hypothetical protein WBK27_03695 [Bacteroidales bacterium]|jgi:esterase/lipase
MAKIRNLKKNLKYWEEFFLANAFLCITTLNTDDENKIEEILELTDELEKYLNDLKKLINNPEHRYKRLPKATVKVERKKLKKEHAKKINEAVINYIQKYNESFEKINEIIINNLQKQS